VVVGAPEVIEVTLNDSATKQLLRG